MGQAVKLFLALCLLAVPAAGQINPFNTCDCKGSGSGGGAGAGACDAGKFVVETVEGGAPVCESAGNVFGPASATDNEIAIYDSTTGKIIKVSGFFVISGALVSPNPFSVKDTSGNQLLKSLEAGTWGGQPTTYIQCGEGSNGCVLTGNSGAIVPWNPQASKFLIGPSQSPDTPTNIAVLQADNKDGTASSVIFRTKARASQTGDHYQAQDSSGNTLATIDVTGGLTLATFARLAPIASPPATCDGTTEGMVYQDASHALCACDGTAYVNLTPASGGACS